MKNRKLNLCNSAKKTLNEAVEKKGKLKNQQQK